MDRWLGSLALLAGAAIIAVTGFTSGSTISTVILLALFAALAWWSWPARRGEHTPHAEVQTAAADDDVIVYWRPG